VPVTVYIPGPLRAFSTGRKQVKLTSSPATLREAMEELWKECPGMRDRIMNEEGYVRQHINIFVGRENVRDTGNFATPLSDGVEISILPAVSGG
jgi:molybdopterin converting factor small subunit